MKIIILGLYALVLGQTLFNMIYLWYYDVFEQDYTYPHAFSEVFSLISITSFVFNILWNCCGTQDKSRDSVSDYTPDITVMIPRYNEKIEVIMPTLFSCFNLKYDPAKLHVVLCDDGRSINDCKCVDCIQLEYPDIDDSSESSESSSESSTESTSDSSEDSSSKTFKSVSQSPKDWCVCYRCRWLKRKADTDTEGSGSAASTPTSVSSDSNTSLTSANTSASTYATTVNSNVQQFHDSIKDGLIKEFGKQRIEEHFEIVTRKNNKGRKAGNLNNALEQSTLIKKCTYIITLDVDMMIKESFIENILPEMLKDGRIGFIQTPQYFRNITRLNDYIDVPNSMFVDYIMTAFSNMNGALYVGTGAMFRKEALDAIGGFVEGYATEDVISGMKINNAGYISKMVKERYTYGLAPGDLYETFEQRLRWIKGNIEVFLKCNPLFSKQFTGLSWKLRLAHFHLHGSWAFSFIYFYQILAQMIWIIKILFQGFAEVPPGTDQTPVLLVFQFSFMSYILFFILLPGCSALGKLHSLQMFFTFIPVYICSLISTIRDIGFKGHRILNGLFSIFVCGLSYISSSVQVVSSKSCSDHRRVHPLYYFHYLIFVAFLILSAMIWTGIRSGGHLIHSTLVAGMLLSIFIAFFPVFKTRIYYFIKDTSEYISTYKERPDETDKEFAKLMNIVVVSGGDE
uniref:Glycosyltransferase 2-like domain-containing protein n=1 Tax=viral metagenome TaxID=1070528 RepID=A0A6C0CMK5_9ZZZZ